MTNELIIYLHVLYSKRRSQTLQGHRDARAHVRHVNITLARNSAGSILTQTIILTRLIISEQMPIYIRRVRECVQCLASRPDSG